MSVLNPFCGDNTTIIPFHAQTKARTTLKFLLQTKHSFRWPSWFTMHECDVTSSIFITQGLKRSFGTGLKMFGQLFL